MNQSMRVAEVLEAALYVADLTAAEQFYTKVLGLTFFSKQEGRHVFFRCGQRMVLLFNAEATSVSAGGSTEIPVHGAKGAGHLAFAARDDEIDRWKDHLAKHGVRNREGNPLGKTVERFTFETLRRTAWKSPRHCCGGSPKRRFPPASNQEVMGGQKRRNISVDLDRVPVWGQ